MSEKILRPTRIRLSKSRNAVELVWPQSIQVWLKGLILRQNSPSADNQSRSVQHEIKTNVKLTGIELVGNYAVKCSFDDGHDTGLYTWELLYSLSQNQMSLADTAERNPLDIEGITVVGVCKRQATPAIEKGYLEGIRHLADNYLQEHVERLPYLHPAVYSNATWHYIGMIQRKKIKAIAQKFDWVQSVDNPDFLPKLNEARVQAGLEKQMEKQMEKPLQVLLQLNLACESTKSGFTELDAVKRALDTCGGYSALNVRGVMAMPPQTDDKEQLKRNLDQVVHAFDILKKDYQLDVLSLGTSNDWQVAVDKGANMIRLGTAVFGERPAKE